MLNAKRKTLNAQNQRLKTIPVLTGPTGTGKSDLALASAERLGLEIISADASMVYRSMDIGTAKPSRGERERVRHHLVDVLEPTQSFSVAEYMHRAEAAISEVLAHDKLPLLTGGTGYYIRALSEGIFELPEPDPLLQQELWKVVESEGLEPLLTELRSASPEDAVRVGQNPRRVVRAVEILRRTGTAPARFPRLEPKFAYAKLILWPAWDWLEGRLQARIDTMFSQGLVEEVHGLIHQYPRMPTALQSIGYKEVLAYLNGEYPLECAKLAVFKATRAYAKRQYTWFRKEPGDVTYLPRGAEAAWDGLLTWFALHFPGTRNPGYMAKRRRAVREPPSP